MNPSSADQIAAELRLKQGIARDEIGVDHLQDRYAGLSLQDSAADFSSISKILLDLPRSVPDSSSIWGVIIETRAHPALPRVIANVLKNCSIPVQLFHGESNLPFIQSSPISKFIGRGDVIPTELKTNELNARQYNALLMSPQFWHLLEGRNKILIFQTDSLCCSNSEYTLEDFTGFDYIGSRWSRVRPVGLEIDGGSGGFSLRDWRYSIECLSRFAPQRWPGGEDAYFAFHMALIGASVASIEQSAEFSTQDIFTPGCFAAHAIRCLKPEHREAFFNYCPEAAEIFPGVYESLERVQ